MSAVPSAFAARPAEFQTSSLRSRLNGVTNAVSEIEAHVRSAMSAGDRGDVQNLRKQLIGAVNGCGHSKSLIESIRGEIPCRDAAKLFDAVEELKRYLLTQVIVRVHEYAEAVSYGSSLASFDASEVEIETPEVRDACDGAVMVGEFSGDVICDRTLQAVRVSLKPVRIEDGEIVYAVSRD